MGRFEALLRDFAGQPHSPAAVALRGAHQTFEASAATWRAVSAEPGWEGESARAASAQFAARGGTIDANGAALLRAAVVVESFNSLIDSARDDLDALPAAAIDPELIGRVVGGLTVLIAGIGPVGDAAGLQTAFRVLAVAREQAAERAVERIRASVASLSSDLSTATVAMSVSQAPAAGKGDAGPTPEDILRDYQVRDDPDGMTTWQPSGFNGWLAEQLGKMPDPTPMTAAEAKLLDNLDPFGLNDFDGIYKDAFATARDRFPSEDGSENDNHTDAFRHAYWNAMLARRFGEPWAADYTTAHEGIPGNPGPREAMDLYNNQIGREIARENPFASDKEIADLIAEAIDDGRLVVVAPNGTSLDWSDRVPLGGAGTVPDGTPARPGRAPDEVRDVSRS